MKPVLRLLSLFLAIVMLSATFVGCNDEKPENDTEKDSAAPSIDAGASKLPDMDWDGEVFNVIGRDADFRTQFTNFEIGYAELPADVVGQAVYQRNDMLHDKYGFYVNPILVSDVAATVQTSYTSGDDLYGLVICKSDQIQAHAQQGYLLDLKDLEYVNLEHESWYPEVNKELEIADKLYYTTNDFMLQDKHRYFYCFYDRGLAADLGLGRFEDMVDNNTWTLENVATLTKQGYAELDGISGATAGDRYGFGFQNYIAIPVLMFSAGFRLTEKDANGYPKLVGATDKMLNIIDEVFKVTEHNGSWCREDYKVYDDTFEPENMFIEGRLLLLNAFTSFIDYFLSCESKVEYCALPNPKLDEKQKNYYVFPMPGHAGFLCVPYTVVDTEFVSFALEALTEESTDTSYTAYIDIKCKYQDAYDEECARMLDLCLTNPIYDIGTFCNFGELFTDLYSGGNGGLAGLGKNFYQRYFDSAKTAAQKQIDELVTEYKKRS